MTQTALITAIFGVSIFVLVSFKSTPTIQATGYQVVDCYSPLNSTRQKQLNCNCPSGKVATGAGWSAEDATNAILVGDCTYFQPGYDGKSWLVNVSSSAPNWKLHVRLLCVNSR